MAEDSDHEPADRKRLDRLREAGLLERGVADEAFDQFSRLAARLLDAPAAAVTVTAGDRQLFKGCAGLAEPLASARQTPLSHSFCRHVVDSGAPLVVPDAREHPLLAGNPAVEESGFVAYVGVPLVSGEGLTLGSLCVISPTSRRWTEAEVATLRDLAASVVTEIEWRIERAERSRTEARLRQREREYRGLFENAHDAILVLAPDDGRVLDANQRACELYGYSRAELVGMPLERVSPDGAHARWLVAETLSRKAPLVFEVDQHGRDGTRLRVEVNASVVEFRGARAILSINRDVTERRRTEEALRASESQLRAIFDEAAVGMAIIDLDGRCVRANRALQTMLGFGEDELLAMLFSQLTHPDDVGSDWELFGNLVAGERTHYQIEKRYFRSDGSMLWGNLNVSLVRDAEGAPCFTVGIVENVTERKQAEEALRQSEDELLQSQKMETVGRLAGGVAHDFNNLLTVIKGNAQLLLADLPTAVGMREELEEIDRLSDRAADLTQQLLAFSRRQVLQPRVLDLNVVVARAERLLRRLLGEDVEFRATLDPALGAVRADPGQMEQVLMNLAINARDAMPGGGKLTLETRNVRLDAEYARRHPSVVPGAYVMVAVSDTGHGMDAETQKRIFDPFFTTKAPGRGTGLGLATVYGIVQQSGGQVWVYSEVGRGSSFKIYLPCVDEVPTRDETARAGVEEERGTETILLVEDDEGVRRIARRVLARAGYHVLEAPTGAAALGAARAYDGRIHLVVTDVVMPGMGGRELAERMSRLRPEAAVLFSSGYTDEAIVHHGVLDEGTAFLQKPYDPSTLLRTVRDAIERPRSGVPRREPA